MFRRTALLLGAGLLCWLAGDHGAPTAWADAPHDAFLAAVKRDRAATGKILEDRVARLAEVAKRHEASFRSAYLATGLDSARLGAELQAATKAAQAAATREEGTKILRTLGAQQSAAFEKLMAGGTDWSAARNALLGAVIAGHQDPPSASTLLDPRVVLAAVHRMPADRDQVPEEKKQEEKKQTAGTYSEFDVRGPFRMTDARNAPDARAALAALERGDFEISMGPMQFRADTQDRYIAVPIPIDGPFREVQVTPIFAGGAEPIRVEFVSTVWPPGYGAVNTSLFVTLSDGERLLTSRRYVDHAFQSFAGHWPVYLSLGIGPRIEATGGPLSERPSLMVMMALHVQCASFGAATTSCRVSCHLDHIHVRVLR
jgi:hypothetical protein